MQALWLEKFGKNDYILLQPFAAMSDSTISAVKKVKGVIRNLLECIDLLWMLEVKKHKANLDDESKKLQSAAKAMQDKLTELAGGIKLEGGGSGGGASANIDMGNFDKDKAEADALENFNTIPFDMNPFF